MIILETGTLSSVTGAALGSGVSTPPINLSMERAYPDIGVWLSVEGDLGRTGGSVSVIAKGSYSKSGVTYTCPAKSSISGVTAQYLVKSGTSVTGFFSDGSYTRILNFPWPWMRLEAFASKAGVTNHGSSVTNACQVCWAVMG